MQKTKKTWRSKLSRQFIFFTTFPQPMPLSSRPLPSSGEEEFHKTTTQCRETTKIAKKNRDRATIPSQPQREKPPNPIINPQGFLPPCREEVANSPHPAKPSDPNAPCQHATPSNSAKSKLAGKQRINQKSTSSSQVGGGFQPEGFGISISFQCCRLP